jgi:hypothetical protein
MIGAFIVKRLNNLTIEEIQEMGKERIEILNGILMEIKEFNELLTSFELKKHFIKDSRESKISQYKRKKEIKEKLQGFYDDSSEREYYYLLIEKKELKMIEIEKSTKMELEILNYNNTITSTINGTSNGIGNGTSNVTSNTNSNIIGINDIADKKEILSSNGKVLRNFIIYNANQRNELKNNVFKQRNLPTMSVQEYIDRELEKGNFIQSTPKEEEEKEEKEKNIYELRAFDDFKDYNPRGWGNRYNKG